jgi:hypothetical protein
MVVNQLHEIDVIESSGIKSIVGKTSVKDMGKILTMLSDNAYSKPIPSILREITSNCFDAHKKAQNTIDNVVINIQQNENEDTKYIEFIDKGTGMSPELIKKVYMQWGNSDKDDNNDYIGGWGLGSKSPFSYTSLFEITTIVDNVKYEYYFHNQQRDKYGNKKFSLDIISTTNTLESNGTTIKIDIKSDNDLESFLNNIRLQLSYFNNLTVLVSIDDRAINRDCVTYNALSGFNQEKIIEYKTFKYRVINTESNGGNTWNSISEKIQDRNETEGLFIIIDSVSYPIDYKQCSELREYRNFFVGLKFTIGELEVTINRESINYTDKTKDCILSRFKEFKKELYSLYIEQNIIIENNYLQYIIDKKNKLRLGNSEYNLVLNMPSAFYIEYSITKTYSHLADLKIFKPDINVLNIFYNIIGSISIDTFIEERYSIDFSSIIKHSTFDNVKQKLIYNKELKLITNKLELANIRNFYTNSGTQIIQKVNDKVLWYKNFCDIKNIYVYSKRKIKDREHGQLRKFNYDYYLELNDDFLNPYFYDHVEKSYEYKNKTFNRFQRKVPVLGKAIEIYKMYKHFKSMFNISNYKDIEITSEMEEDYLEYRRELNPQYKKKKDQKFSVNAKGYGKEEYDIESFLNLAKNIIYVIKYNRNNSSFTANTNENNDRIYIKNLVEIYKNNVKNKLSDKEYCVVELSETVLKDINRRIKTRINLKLLDKNPLMTPYEFYCTPYIKNLILRCNFYYRYCVNDLFTYTRNQQLIIDNNKRITHKIYLVVDYYNELLNSLYFNNYNLKGLKSNILEYSAKYFKIEETDYRTNSIISDILDIKKELTNEVEYIVSKNDLLKYLSHSTPNFILKKYIKGVKSMNYFYDIPDYVTNIDRLKIEQQNILTLF